MATVLLINPPVWRVQEREYDAPLFPCEALAWLAPPVQREGHRAVLLDAKLERLDPRATLERARGVRPDLVGITAYTHEVKRAAALATDLRRVLGPKVPLLLGGPHATAIPEQTLAEFDAFDLAFQGEGEQRLPPLVEALLGGRSPGEVDGVVWRGPDGVQSRSFAGVRPDLERHRPDFSLLPPARHYFYGSSRGCPYQCAFCANPNGRTVRALSPERVVADLTAIWDHAHPEMIRFGNENFLLPRRRARAVMAALIEAGLHRRFVYEVQTSLQSLDPQSIALLRASGCFKVCFGLESGDPEVLAGVDKPVDLRRASQVNEALRRSGLEVEINAILGHPGETLRSARRTVDAMVALNPTRPSLGLMTPYPGTRVAELARRGEGGYRLLSEDWDDYGKQCGGALELEGLSRRELERLQLACVLRVFVQNGRFAELARFVWDYRREALFFAQNFLRH